MVIFLRNINLFLSSSAIIKVKGNIIPVLSTLFSFFVYPLQLSTLLRPFHTNEERCTAIFIQVLATPLCHLVFSMHHSTFPTPFHNQNIIHLTVFKKTTNNSLRFGNFSTTILNFYQLFQEYYFHTFITSLAYCFPKAPLKVCQTLSH